MKKILLLFAMLAFIGNVKAQTLYVNNTSCTDIEFVVFAGELPNDCGPVEDDKSQILSVSAGNAVFYAFGTTTSATGFTWNSSGTGTPSSSITGGNFNFFRADVGTPCWGGTGSSGICSLTGVDMDGTTVYNDMGGSPNTPCGSPTSSSFLIDDNTACATLACSCVLCCIPPSNCAVCPNGPHALNAALTMSGGDWYLNITQY